jgi:undecaprenyl-diphosphatase
MTDRKHFIALAAAALLFLLLGLLGGAGQRWEVELLGALGEWRRAQAEATLWVVRLTHAGGALFLLLLTAGGMLLLWLRGEARRAAALGMTVVAGRLGLELLKWLFDRPRPSFDVHPVMVFSQSFPSGHAGNSMITYAALALFLVPARWRGPALVAAFLFALAIGATRPILGVHWPSDVLGGWIYGAAVVALGWTISRRPRSAA